MTSWILLSLRSSTVNTQIAQLPEAEVVPVAALGCLESPVEGGGSVTPSARSLSPSHRSQSPSGQSPTRHTHPPSPEY
ncbi:hypothetical protein QQF64_009648 [Cirrhinus molitorella]|uniref:Uncharacterized protein n=1 Tax=Cirrhinus molitorella TaxID=172907 RepID=A0ABR3M1R6_9TELE